MIQPSNEFLRVNRTKAERLYNEGYTVYLLPCKVRPDFNAAFILPYDINIKVWQAHESQPSKFDNIVNYYHYYNCNYEETGKYIAFYVLRKEAIK
jgi:hypothetical protein